MSHQAQVPSFLDHTRDGVGDRRTYRRGNLIAGLTWGISSLILVKLVIWGTIEVARTSDPQGLLEAAASSDQAPWPWLGFLAALIGFIPLAIILPITIERLHKRSWRTSMTPYLTVNVGQILRGAGIFAALYLLVAGASVVLLRGSLTFSFDFGQFLPGLFVLMALVWVQAFGQELIFRGYGLQTAWLEVKTPGVLATLSGLAFGVPFLFAPFIVEWIVPEIQVPDISWGERAILMLGYVLVGAALAMASIRTGTIELAIGAAFSFNFLTALVLAPRAGQMAGGSLVELESGVVPSAGYVGLLAIALFVFARVSRRLVPNPSGRPLLRNAAAADVLALPAGNPMWRVSIRNLLAHKLRLVLTVVTIALSVSFIAATMVFSDTTNRALDLFFDSEPADVVVRPVDPVTVLGRGEQRAEELTMPADLADTVAAVPGVESATPSVNQEGVLVLDESGQPLGGPSSAHVGASWNGATLPSGAEDLLAELPRGIGQVALDRTTADRLGVTVGDTVQLVTPLQTDRNREWTVTGIVDIGLAGGATVAVFDLPTAQQLITGPGRVNQLLVATTQPPAVVAKAINDELGRESDVSAITGRQAADAAAERVGERIGFLNTLLTVFGFIAVITAVFLIFNTFAMLVTQRRREMSLLRAVGAGAQQIQGSVVIQALVLGIIGTIVGVVLGLYLAVGLRSALRWFNIDVPGGALVISPRTLLIAALVGIGATALAAWAPASRAGRVPPIEGLAADPSLSRDVMQRRAVIAALLGTFALLTAVIGLRDSLANNAVAWVGLSAPFAIAAFILVTPWFARPVLAVLGAPLRQVTGRLAVANNRRNPRRVTNTTAALTIGVALIGMITVLTTSATATADVEIDRAFGSDLSIGAPPLYRPYDHSITEQAAAVPGVGQATYIRTTDGQRQDIPVPVFGVQPDAITSAVNLVASSGDLTMVGDDRIALDSRLAQRYGITVGEDFTAEYRTGPATLEVVAIFEPVVVFQGILTDLATAEELGAPPGQDTAAYFTYADGADEAAVRAGIQRSIDRNPALQLQDTETLKRDFAEQVNQLLGFVFAMLALAVIIAVLSIVNTLLLSVRERTSEIGMLRAIGSTQEQVRAMVAMEAAILGVFGALCGIALGLLYGALLRAVMAPLGITELAIPWGWLVVSVICGALAGVLASLWPAITASRTDVLAAIATE